MNATQKAQYRLEVFLMEPSPSGKWALCMFQPDHAREDTGGPGLPGTFDTEGAARMSAERWLGGKWLGCVVRILEPDGRECARAERQHGGKVRWMPGVFDEKHGRRERGKRPGHVASIKRERDALRTKLSECLDWIIVQYGTSVVGGEAKQKQLIEETRLLLGGEYVR